MKTLIIFLSLVSCCVGEFFPLRLGDPLKIICFGGTAEPVDWSKDGRIIANNERVNIIGGNLTVEDPLEKDAGVYECFHNDRSEVNSVYLHEWVNITSTAQVGGNITLVCAVRGVDAQYNFEKENQPFNRTDERITLDKNTLTVTNFSQSDIGNYSCIAIFDNSNNKRSTIYAYINASVFGSVTCCSGGAIVGIVFGAIVIFALVFLIFFLIFKKYFSKKVNERKHVVDDGPMEDTELNSKE